MLETDKPDEANAPGTTTQAQIRQLQTTFKAAAFGEVMGLLLQSPRHADLTLKILSEQLLPAFLTGQFLLLRAKPGNEEAPSTPIAVAFWASVSKEIDDRIEADLSNPIALAPNEWKSGETVWVLDVIGPPKVTATLFQSIREKLGPDTKIKVKAAGANGERGVKLID